MKSGKNNINNNDESIRMITTMITTMTAMAKNDEANDEDDKFIISYSPHQSPTSTFSEKPPRPVKAAVFEGVVWWAMAVPQRHCPPHRHLIVCCITIYEADETPPYEKHTTYLLKKIESKTSIYFHITTKMGSKVELLPRKLSARYVK
ncbi:hypothetical protein HELRODRAFT_166612 [Helobdella robusta]|uniref:Uncharacterized protein n=1 Tax=Helobdella robusta TaxID=6412 RepID=T1EYA7_HELRO|nr:hypothetical protein HELRODRAFT_166612 [Helobdella robusta]ESO11600.1 hypothetical protein HELRODRAFT_166612 [Helobdella robusta]